MTTYIQISAVAFDHIESDKERKILEGLSGDEAASGFVYIVDGDESLVRETSSNPLYDEIFTRDEFLTLIEEHENQDLLYDISRIIVDDDVDGISDYLAEIGYERRDGFHAGESAYVRG